MKHDRFRCRMSGLLLLTALVTSATASAADVQGQFSVRGAGLLSCETFNKERKAESVAYQMIGGWIDGYITAINAASANTYDITSYQSTEMLTEIIQHHCKQYPKHRLFNVLGAITRQLHAQRVDKASPMQRIAIEDKETYLYTVTIARMQRVLAKQSYLQQEAVNGRFDENTAKALREFQAAKALKPTGFPDQTTLWLLFEPRSSAAQG